LTRGTRITYFLISMSSEVKVDLGERSYRIVIGENILAGLGEACKPLDLGGNCLVVSDSNVGKLYAGAVCESLEGAGFSVSRSEIPAGEQSKCADELNALYEDAIDAGLDRKGFIVALGGGVVGDIAGYLAATFLRGIRFVQVPTSLLAMVDSSVGGKTGINLPRGKNLVGSFHQPVLVWADTSTLSTLAKREYVSGLAEVVKYGVIRDADLFALLESQASSVLAGHTSVVNPIIARCCEIKADVVREDEREGGVRAILNFGHTLGHAIETISGYGAILHGEAIAMGMVYAARLSAALCGMPEKDVERLVALLKTLDLPAEVPDADWDEIRKAISVDKKVQGRAPRFVLSEKIGAVKFGCEVPEELLEKTWAACKG